MVIVANTTIYLNVYKKYILNLLTTTRKRKVIMWGDGGVTNLIVLIILQHTHVWNHLAVSNLILRSNLHNIRDQIYLNKTRKDHKWNKWYENLKKLGWGSWESDV